MPRIEYDCKQPSNHGAHSISSVCGELIGQYWRILRHLILGHGVPDREDNFLSTLFQRHQPVEFPLGPTLLKEMRTENDDTESAFRQTFINLLSEAVPDSQFLPVEPNFDTTASEG